MLPPDCLWCNVEKDIVQVWEAPVVGRVLRRREAGRGRAQVTSFTLALVRLEAPRAEEAAAGGADNFPKVGEPLRRRLHGPAAKTALNVLGNMFEVRREAWAHVAVWKGAS